MPNSKYGHVLFDSLNRLKRINWLASGDPESHAQWIAEYLRRVAVMSNELGLDLSSPFFKPVKILVISGDQSADAMVEFMAIAEDADLVKNAYVRRSCECYLEWSEGGDEGRDVALAYPDIFDPLISLIESGGKFGLHHGEIMVGSSAIPLNNWKRFAGYRL
ncbi:hypothetical protein [Hahella sp. NBU794]|uniref:hypothetical protein n=1 Tax=Hahella sp. NBU794 TaxID=3422590 RepID=UPI003D6F9D92